LKDGGLRSEKGNALRRRLLRRYRRRR
jgi:hypothetical protein